MSIIKRLSATLVSHIDSVVSEIENHEAVVQAALNDMGKKVAEAKVRMNRVHRDQALLENKIREKQQDVQRWRKRAIDCAESDESRALECVSRSRQCEQQIEHHQQSLLQYRQTAEKLAADIELSELQLAEIKQKLTLMRARQSTSSALRTSGEQHLCSSLPLDDVFDRWEINISHDEMASVAVPLSDAMEREFLLHEQQDELRAELQSMISEKKS